VVTELTNRSTDRCAIWRWTAVRHLLRAALRVFKDGSPAFSLYDPMQRERLIVHTDKDGKPSIRLIDPDKSSEKAHHFGRQVKRAWESDLLTIHTFIESARICKSKRRSMPLLHIALSARWRTIPT
jgi:hypothetical protein